MKKYNEIFEGAYKRIRVEEGQEIIILSEAAFSMVKWNCNSLEDEGIILTEDENIENLWTISDGKDSIILKVEKQIHRIINHTWKIDGQKFEDGTTIKLNGTYKGDYEVWSNATIRDNGKRTWKRLSVTKSESEGKKNLEKAIKEYKKNLKAKKEAK